MTATAQRRDTSGSGPNPVSGRNTINAGCFPSSRAGSGCHRHPRGAVLSLSLRSSIVGPESHIPAGACCRRIGLWSLPNRSGPTFFSFSAPPAAGARSCLCLANRLARAFGEISFNACRPAPLHKKSSLSDIVVSTTVLSVESGVCSRQCGKPRPTACRRSARRTKWPREGCWFATVPVLFSSRLSTFVMNL